MHPHNRTVYLAICLLATLCQSSSLFADTEKQPVSSTNNPTGQVAYIHPKDHSEVLYKLLVAELASSRNLSETALSHILEAAQNTKDPAIAAHSTEMAIQFQAPTPAIESAEIWAQNAQDDLQAQMVAATLLIGQSIERAMPYLTRAIEINPVEVNQHVITIQSRLSEKSAEHLNMALQLIAKKREKDPHAQLIVAQSFAQLGDIPKATQAVDTSLQLNPELTQALQLKARLIRYEDKNDTRAIQYLSDNVIKYPKNSELRLFLASALMDAQRFNEAITQLNKLTDDKTYAGQALLFLGEIHYSINQPEKSKTYLRKALHHKEVEDNAAFDLGQLAEKQNLDAEAIQWYSFVNPGLFQVPATLRAVALLKKNKEFKHAIHFLREASPSTFEEQKQLLLSEVDVLAAGKQLEEAYTLISGILEKLPEDVDVLYSHSIVATKLKKWTIAENNLKLILKINPNYSDAMNALGYLLSEQNGRLDEASQYVTQALKLAPKNSSYLDSMGWIEFKKGNAEHALVYLKEAHTISPNAEIAAHLGEVLWQSGKKDAAIKLFTESLKKTPNNDALQDTVNRLKIDHPSLKATGP